MNITRSERLRMRLGNAVLAMIRWKHGDGDAGYWLWNWTPYPFGPPWWGDLWFGLRAAMQSRRSREAEREQNRATIRDHQQREQADG